MLEDKRQYFRIVINAFVRFYQESRSSPTIYYRQGVVKNYSRGGMFVSTNKKIELGRKVSFFIEFKSNSCNGPLFLGKGIVTRSHSTGLAIRFVEFDMSKLQECIFWMIDNT